MFHHNSVGKNTENGNFCENLTTSQQFCVRWNSHLGSLGAAFPQLLAGQRFVDVTLACEGHQLHCHRLVLAACSSFFESLLGENPCKHPIVILPQDVKLWEIQALVDFMYKGEVNVSQAGLSDLLKCAEILKIRGLSEGNSSVDLNQVRAESKHNESTFLNTKENIEGTSKEDQNKTISNFKSCKKSTISSNINQPIIETSKPDDLSAPSKHLITASIENSYESQISQFSSEPEHQKYNFELDFISSSKKNTQHIETENMISAQLNLEEPVNGTVRAIVDNFVDNQSGQRNCTIHTNNIDVRSTSIEIDMKRSVNFNNETFNYNFDGNKIEKSANLRLESNKMINTMIMTDTRYKNNNFEKKKNIVENEKNYLIKNEKSLKDSLNIDTMTNGDNNFTENKTHDEKCSLKTSFNLAVAAVIAASTSNINHIHKNTNENSDRLNNLFNLNKISHILKTEKNVQNNTKNNTLSNLNKRLSLNPKIEPIDTSILLDEIDDNSLDYNNAGDQSDFLVSKIKSQNEDPYYLDSSQVEASEYDNNILMQNSLDNSQVGKKIRRSEAILRQAAECVSKGQTFQTVSDMFNIPISTIRFFMARKGILPRRKRGRSAGSSLLGNFSHKLTSEILNLTAESGTNEKLNNFSKSSSTYELSSNFKNPVIVGKLDIESRDKFNETFTDKNKTELYSRSFCQTEAHSFNFKNFNLPEIKPKLV